MTRELLFVSVVCLFMLGCQGTHHVVESKYSSTLAAKKHSIKRVSSKRCMIECEQNFKSCKSQCHDSCRQCQRVANKQAWEKYRVYTQQVKVECSHRPRDWLSFRDPLQCRKVSCNCFADLSACAQRCGGIIKKSLRATPYCQ